MKLFFKILIFITIIVFFISTLNKHIPSTGDLEKIKVDSLILNKNKIKSVVLGRSHAASLDYLHWDIHGINFALGGRDLAGIDYQLGFFLDNLPEIKEILISISYSTMYYDNESLSLGNLNDVRKSLYYSIPSYSIIDYKDLNNYVYGKYFPFIQADHGYKLFKKVYSNTMEKKEKIDLNEDYMDSLLIIKSSKDQAILHSSDRKIAEAYNSNVITKNKEYLIDIIHKTKRKKINLIFFTPPYYKNYTDFFPKNDMQEMKKIMNELAVKYSITYLDFSTDSIISNNYKYFQNADHMNNHGKRIFTKKLLKKIKDLNIRLSQIND
jgi:hypothetical protein|tara:strand:+ start:3275 stop:4246 length:972 start_codon:yes stop_codon:yes gene_type:complete